MPSLGLKLRLDKITYRLASVVTAGLAMWHKMTAGVWAGSARLSDSSTNSNDAKLYTGTALDFDGVNDYVDVGDTGKTIKSVVFYVKPDTTTEKFLQLQAAGAVDVGCSAGVLTTTGWTSPVSYVNGTAGNTITAGTWQQVVITSATGISASDVQLGISDTTYYAGQMADVRLYSVELSASQVAELYANPESATATGVTESDIVVFARDIHDNTFFSIAAGGEINGAAIAEKNNGHVYQRSLLGLSKYLYFDQVGTYVDIPDFTPTSEYTLYFDQALGNTSSYISGIVGTGGNNMHLSINGYVTLYLGSATGTPISGKYIDYRIGWRCRIAVRIKSGDIKLYVNGIEKATSSAVVTYDQNWGAIGKYATASSSMYKGIIYEAAFFDSALTDTQLQQLTDGTITPATLTPWGWWKNSVGSTWTDLSGNGRDGTVMGSKPIAYLPTVGETDIFGQSQYKNTGELILNGDGYALVPDAASLDITGSITLEAWVKPFEVSAQQCVIGKNGAYALKLDATGKPLFSKYTTATESTATTATTTLAVDTWYHIAAVYDGSNVVFYVNGSVDTTVAMTGAIDANANDVYMASLDGTNEMWKGYLDSVKVYGEAKGASDILENYNAEKAQHS